MKKTYKYFLIFLLAFLANPVYAMKVNTLYQAQIPVHTQADAERLKAIQQAINLVLIKVSGNANIVYNDAIKSGTNSADSLVQEYSYSNNRNNREIPYLLNIRFDADAINQILRDANAPIWGQNRPLILLWVDFEFPGHTPEILSNDSTNMVVSLFKQSAEFRGLPLLFPIMDMTDMNLVSVNDIATFTPPNLINAAKRYASDAILIGRVQLVSEGYHAQWKLLNGENEWTWEMTDRNLESIIQNMTDHITTTVALRYAVVTTNAVQNHISLQVKGVTEQADFARLLRYLNHLTPVAQVTIEKIVSNEIILNISLRSSDDAFYQALTLGKKLTPIPSSNTSSSLIYQWND